jgi:tetratricopeptide (TPR) repeat protein
MKNLVAAAAIAAALTVPASEAVGQGGYREPNCDIKKGHFLVNSAVVYIKGASEEGDPVKRQSMLNNAERNLHDALDRGQEENPGVWYFLGRYYVMTRDLIGADSAFDRAAELEPRCAEDILYYRQVLWVPTINQAIDSMRTGRLEGAKSILSQANRIYPDDSRAAFYLARIFGNEGELDSAVHYFKAVVESGDADSSRAQDYETSVFNLGLIYGMMQQWDSSATWYARYRDQIDANDPQALMGLAQALSEAGEAERALVLYDSVMMLAEQMDPLDLFRTGEILFRAERFTDAAEAFELGLKGNPFFRPGLYNLANAYLAIHNDVAESEPEKEEAALAMEAAALRLVEVDPQNVESLNLLAASYQLQRKDDSTLAVLERREALTFEVQIDQQQTVEGGYSVQGRLVNPKEEEVAAPAVMFEFLDAQGNVIMTSSVQPMTLAANGSSPFTLNGVGEEIVAARYTVQQ